MSLVHARPLRGPWGALPVLAAVLVALVLVAAPAAGARRAVDSPPPSIAFIRDQHVWKVSPDGSGLVQLTRGRAEEWSPVWSPDRSTIAFARWSSTNDVSYIYTVPAAGGAARLLYKDRIPKVGFIQVTGLAYSPDGSRLAFADVYSAKGAIPVGTRLVVIDIATGRTSVMLKKTGGFGNCIVTSWSLSWSPDGSAILISQQGQDDEGGGTWVYTIVSGQTKRIPVADASIADWAADGRSVLLSVSTQSKTIIKRTGLDGSAIRTLATGGGWQGRPSVGFARSSPDGMQVVYAKDWNALWIMDADGSGKHKVTAGNAPAW